MSDLRIYLLDFRNFRDWLQHGGVKTLVVPEEGILYSYRPIDNTKLIGFVPSLGLMSLEMQTSGDRMAMLVSMIDRTNPGKPVRFAIDIYGVVSCNREDVGHLFKEEMFESLRFVPSYIAATMVKIVRKKTLKKVRRPGSKKKVYGSRYRIIRSVKRIYLGPKTKPGSSGRHFDHQIPVQGYWRTVKGIGKDAEGRPVVGKTWVKGFVRCPDKPKREIIYVKEPLELK